MIGTLLAIGGAPGGDELLLVFVVFLLLFGAKRLPGMAHSLGRALESMRRAMREAREELTAAGDDGEAGERARAGRGKASGRPADEPGESTAPDGADPDATRGTGDAGRV
jgi:sec-independent protein translocase protein TatA